MRGRLPNTDLPDELIGDWEPSPSQGLYVMRVYDSVMPDTAFSATTKLIATNTSGRLGCTSSSGITASSWAAFGHR